MTDYSNLKPGVYLQHGENFIKTAGREYVGSFSDWIRGGGSAGSVEKLAASVGWVYTALNERKKQMLEIEQTWKQNDNEIDFVPFGVKWMQLEQRIDESLQLYSIAYALKQRSGRRITGVRWLDPMAVSPVERSANVATEDYDFYTYTVQGGEHRTIPREDLFIWKIPGLREIEPGTSAGMATKLAASIMYGIGQTANTFYGNNALPIMLVIVPDETIPQEKIRLQDRFKSLFNGGEGTLSNRTVAVSQSIEVKQLSLAPKDLAQKELEDSEIDLILAAHSVPKSVVLSNAANYATDIAARRSFVSTVGGRLRLIAEVINTDTDMMALGLSLGIHIEQHYTMKEDEKEQSTAILNYVNSGFTTEATAWLFGIRAEDFPPGMTVFQEYQEPEPQPMEEPEPEEAEEEAEELPEQESETKSAEHLDERRQFKAWYKKRVGQDASKFNAHYLNDGDKADVIADVLKADLWESY